MNVNYNDYGVLPNVVCLDEASMMPTVITNDFTPEQVMKELEKRIFVMEVGMLIDACKGKKKVKRHEDI